MGIAIAIFSILTVLCVLGAIVAAMNVRHAEDNFNVAFCIIGAVLFGAIDLVLVVIKAAIT